MAIFTMFEAGDLMETAQKQYKCHICNQYNDKGIWLVGGYICSACLDEISMTDAKDPKYTFFVRKLKELWQMG